MKLFAEMDFGIGNVALEGIGSGRNERGVVLSEAREKSMQQQDSGLVFAASIAIKDLAVFNLNFVIRCHIMKIYCLFNFKIGVQRYYFFSILYRVMTNINSLSRHF